MCILINARATYGPFSLYPARSPADQLLCMGACVWWCVCFCVCVDAQYLANTRTQQPKKREMFTFGALAGSKMGRKQANEHEHSLWRFPDTDLPPHKIAVNSPCPGFDRQNGWRAVFVRFERIVAFVFYILMILWERFAARNGKMNEERFCMVMWWWWRLDLSARDETKAAANDDSYSLSFCSVAKLTYNPINHFSK